MKKFIVMLTLFATVPASVGAHGGAEPAHRRATWPTSAAGRTDPTQVFPVSATSGDYRLTVRSSTSITAGRRASLELALARSGEAVEDLEIVHEKPMHLIAVSQDLGHFLHLHPVVRSGGMLDLDATFPEGGEWVLFADFTERGRDRTVIRMPIRITGEAETHGHGLEVSGFPLRDPATGTRISLVTDPPALRPGENRLTFRLTDASGPVTDLEPVLGSLGHLVVIREGARSASDYLHAHPEGGAHAAHSAEMSEMDMSMTDTGTSPGEVAFDVEFPSPGRYKAWVEFNRGGRRILLPFVVAVGTREPASRPASTPAARPHSDGHHHD